LKSINYIHTYTELVFSRTRSFYYLYYFLYFIPICIFCAIVLKYMYKKIFGVSKGFEHDTTTVLVKRNVTVVFMCVDELITW
jgi:hypothetical protein